MKYITILILFVAAGCGKSDIERLETENRRLEAELENKELKANLAAENTRLKKELKKMDVVGTYHWVTKDGITANLILRENGTIWIGAKNDDRPGRSDEGNWKLVGNEIHVWEKDENFINVIRIEENGDLTTKVAFINNGQRRPNANGGTKGGPWKKKEDK